MASLRRSRPPRRLAPGSGSGSGSSFGFTLVEVMVALAAVAIALGAGIKAAGALTANAERLAAVSAAGWCADNRLVAIQLANEFPGTGDYDFSCEQLGVVYRGRLVVRQMPNPGFRRIDAQLADPAGMPLFTLSTVVWRN